MKVKRKCLICGNNLIGRKGKMLCSRKCSHFYRSDESKILEDDLITYHCISKLELQKIADIYNTSIQTIIKYINKYNIKLRPNYDDLTGFKKGKVKILNPLPEKPGEGKHQRWNCICDCGKKYTIASSAFKAAKNLKCYNCSKIDRRSKLELPYYIFSRYLYNAKKRNLEFNLTIDYLYQLFLKQDRKCALSGIKIKFPKTGREFAKGIATASLDRINSKKGYVEGNVQWVHKHINMMKGSMNNEKFKNICSIIHNNK